MAYNKEDLIKKSLAAIKKHELIFIDEVVSYLPCAMSTFYAKKLEESEAIREALQNNKVATKSHLRKKWKKGDNPALNLALYRLCSTDEEKEKIAPTTNHKVTGKIEGTMRLTVEKTDNPLPRDDKLK